MTTSYCSTLAITFLTVLVLASLIHANTHLAKEEKRRFYLVGISIIIAAVFEWLAVLLDGAPMWTYQIHRVVKCMDYITTPVCALFFVRQMSTNKYLRASMLYLLIANAVFEFISIFTGWTFYLDNQNFYHHGSLHFIYIAVFVCAIVFVVAAFLEYGRKYENKNRAPLFASCCLMAVSVLLQEILGGDVRTDYPGMAICTVFLYIHYIEFRQISQDQTIVQKDALLAVDALTGVLSRYAYIQTSSDYSKEQYLPDWLAAFEANLNGLKGVNDTVGHEAGDELLRAAAGVLKDTVGESGKVFRTGGDEFVILLDTRLASADEIEKAIRENADAWKGELSQELSFSIGHASVAEFPAYDILQLVHAADQRMYEDKARYYSMPGHDRRRTGRQN